MTRTKLLMARLKNVTVRYTGRVQGGYVRARRRIYGHIRQGVVAGWVYQGGYISHPAGSREASFCSFLLVLSLFSP